MTERVCTAFRCNRYQKDTVNNIGITNCGGNGWMCSIKFTCPFQTYAQLLQCSAEDTDGTYGT